MRPYGGGVSFRSSAVLRLRGLPPMVRLGLALVLAGGLGDGAFHLLASPLPPALDALLGADGGRAHLLTFFGMLVAVLGLMWQARSSSIPL